MACPLPPAGSRSRSCCSAGSSIREPIAAYGPFVMNNRAEEKVQAVEDFQAGRLGTVPADGLRPYRVSLGIWAPFLPTLNLGVIPANSWRR